MRNRRIGIVTPNIEDDWESTQLLDVDSGVEALPVDPMSFEMRIHGTPSIRIAGRPAEDFDALIVRGFNKLGEIDYQYEVFELYEQLGGLVINSPASLSLAESKPQTTYCLQRAGLPVPRTFATQVRDNARMSVREFHSAVAKPLYGSHGIGIEKLEGADGEEMAADLMKAYGALCIQEYVPNAGRDIRAFVIGDEVSAAMYRIAREGEWKTNVFQGSRCEPCELSAELRELCVKATSVIGLDYTGVDIMEGPDGPVILELNGTPSWYGLSHVTDRNIAEDIVSYVIRMLEAGRSARQPEGFLVPERIVPDT